MSHAMDKREINQFGFLDVEDNPITKVGVFPYLGSQIGAPEKDRVYMVYRPESELNNPEAIKSARLSPFINEHPKTLLGNVKGLVTTDDKRIEGVFGEKVYFEYPYLKANLRVYSAQTLESIDLGKEQLSAGYSCEWVAESGVWVDPLTGESHPYQYVQRVIRFNHGALVEEGRSGPDVSVMDSMTFNLESKEQQMELAELVKSVAALTAQMTTIQGAMDSMKKAMDESEEDKDKKDKDGKAQDEDDDDKKDDDKDKDDKKAMDEDDDKKEDKDDKKEAMDSAAFKRAVSAEVARQLAKQPAALDSGAMMAEIAKKNALVAKVSAHIGTFACDSMTYDGVAEYAAEKLGLPKDNAAIRVESYLQAKPASPVAYSMDSAQVKASDGAAQLAKHFA